MLGSGLTDAPIFAGTLADMNYDVYHGTIDSKGDQASQLFYAKPRCVTGKGCTCIGMKAFVLFLLDARHRPPIS